MGAEVDGDLTHVYDMEMEMENQLLYKLFPQHYQQIYYKEGLTHYREGNYINARKTFEKAHKVALKNLWREMNSDASKQKLAVENKELYAKLVYCCLDGLDGTDENSAFKYTTAAKGQAFVDVLNRINFDIHATIKQNKDCENLNQVNQDVDYYRDQMVDTTKNYLKYEDKNLKRLGSKKVSNKELEKQAIWKKFIGKYPALTTALEKQTTIWKKLTVKYPALTATQTPPTLIVKQARILAQEIGATLVEYYQHDKGWAAFVVTKEKVQHVSLPLINDNLFKDMEKWIKFIETRKPIAYSPIRTRRTLSQWHEAVIAPLQAHLPQGERVILAPFGKLYQLPLHIALDPSTNRYLVQDYSIAFVSSLSALRISLDQASKKQCQPVNKFQRFLNVAHPGIPNSQEYDYLDNAVPAALAIAKTLTKVKVTPLYEDKATSDAFITHASGQDIIHFFGHGDFVPEHPEKSGLMLAKGWLTVQDIIAQLNLEQVRLTTLGACKTVWLTQALMTAKTQAVVTTLWNVDQDATVALFKTFYNELAKGHDPVESLNLATKTIRERPEWQHPYYWAAFQISGLAYNFPNSTNGEST